MPGPTAVTKTNFVPTTLPKPLTIAAMWSSAAMGNSAKRVVADDGGQEQGAAGTHAFATYIPSVLSSRYVIM